MLKGKMPIIISIILALIAGLLSMYAIKKERIKVRKGWNLKTVIVAAKDLNEGDKITYDNIAKRKIPEQFITESVIRPEQVASIVGQKLAVKLRAGDMIMWSDLQSLKETERLSKIIRKKGRAISIRVSPEAAVSQWIRPNDHVDIIGTFRDPKTRDFVTVTLLQDIIVLATGKITGKTDISLLSPSEINYKEITLLVLPEEAEILTLAQEVGKLYITLRNPEDLSVQKERSKVTIDTLLTGERAKQLRAKRVKYIQIIKGGSSERQMVGQ